MLVGLAMRVVSPSLLPDSLRGLVVRLGMIRSEVPCSEPDMPARSVAALAPVVGPRKQLRPAFSCAVTATEPSVPRPRAEPADDRVGDPDDEGGGEEARDPPPEPAHDQGQGGDDDPRALLHAYDGRAR